MSRVNQVAVIKPNQSPMLVCGLSSHSYADNPMLNDLANITRIFFLSLSVVKLQAINEIMIHKQIGIVHSTISRVVSFSGFDSL